MPVRFNIGGGISAGKDTATEDDVRYPKTFHSGNSVVAKIGRIKDCVIKKIVPGKNKQTIPAGSYIAEDIIIDGDDNLIPGNIRNEAVIFGVRGDPNVVDTSAGDITSDSVLSGHTGFSKGKSVPGGIEVISGDKFSPSDQSAYNDSKIVAATENGYAGLFTYAGVKGYIADRITIPIANLLSQNIRNGARIGGIGGYIEGRFTGDATAKASYILEGKTAGIAGKMETGTMPNIPAIDPCKSAVLNNGYLYLRISYGAHVIAATAGYPEARIGEKMLANVIGLTAQKLAPGESCLGITGSGSGRGRFALLSAFSVRGYGMSSVDYIPSDEKVMIMPADGIVTYTGVAASYLSSGVAVCEIYKNGSLVDSLNINAENNYAWRTTEGKYFTAKSGDRIKVLAQCLSGADTISALFATAIY